MLCSLAVPLALMFAGCGVESLPSRGYQPAAVDVRPPPGYGPYNPPAYPPAYPPALLRRQYPLPPPPPFRPPVSAPLPPPVRPRVIYRLPPPPFAPPPPPIIVESAECGTSKEGGECCNNQYFCPGDMQIDEELGRCAHKGPAAVCCRLNMCLD